MFNWIIGIPLLTLFASVGLAVIVIPSTRREASRFTLNVLLVLIALWTFCSFMLHSLSSPSTLFWMYLIVIFAAYTSAVSVHFSFQFTKRTGTIAKWLVGMFYISGSLVLVPLLLGKIVTEATLLPNGAVEISFGPMAPFMWGVMTVSTLVAIAVLISTLVSPLRIEKRYAIIPVLGFTVMCLGGLSNLIVSSYPVDIAANFIFIALISYAVVSRHVLRSAQRQPWWMSLPVTGGLLALCYAAMFTLCLKWLGIQTGYSHLIATITVSIFGLVTFGPSRMFLSNKLAQSFFPNIYRYQKSLMDLSSVDNSLNQWANSVTNILNIIAKATRADNAMLLIRNSKTKDFEVKHAVGRDSASMLHLRLPVDSPLVKTLVERGDALSTGEIERQITLKALLRSKGDTLQEISPTLYCGVRGYDGLLAIIALTRKSPHVWDQAEDRDFLELAGRHITPIIENTLLYQASQREITERKQAEEQLRLAEQNFRNSLDNSPLGVLIIKEIAEICYANKAMLDIFGYSNVEEFNTVPWKERYTSESHARHREREEKRKRGEFVPNTYGMSIVRKDGKVRYLMVFDKKTLWDGEILSMRTYLDITERKLAEEKIKRAAEEWRTTFDSITDLVFICDKDFRIIRVNKAFTNVFEMKYEELLNKKCYQVVHGTNEPMPNCPYKKTIKTKKPATAEFFEPHLGMYLEMSTSPIFNEKGEVVACVHLIRDITERKQTEQKAREVETLREVDRLRSGLLANVSHELRTPLASIKGFTSTLLREDVRWSEEEQRDFLETIDHETNRLIHLINDLLDMSRIEAGGLKLDKRDYQIAEVLDSVSSHLVSLTERHRLEVKVPSELPPVFVDPMRIGQVLTNLVENAAKYSSGGREITVEAQLAGEQIIASVTDRGEGIDPKLLGRVFDRFYQAESIVSGRKSGTGLGLSICKGIIEAHGGRIWLESKPGEGSKFSFSLPVGKGKEEIA